MQPCTATSWPLQKYLHTNSAVPRHATISMKSASRTPLAPTNCRFTARVKLVTDTPLGVCFSSGPAYSRPIRTAWFNIGSHLFCPYLTTPFFPAIIQVFSFYFCLAWVASLAGLFLCASAWGCGFPSMRLPVSGRAGVQNTDRTLHGSFSGVFGIRYTDGSL